MSQFIQTEDAKTMAERDIRRLAHQRIWAATPEECGVVELVSMPPDGAEPVDAASVSEGDEVPQTNRLRAITRVDVVAKASEAAFGKPLVTNIFRAMLAEAIVAEALSTDWTCCSADWAGWDFQSLDGIKLEVKQSASRQSWAAEASPPTKCSFDIACRTGYFEGTTWIQFPKPDRLANIYVFAHHPVTDISADHRDPQQWKFYVVPTLKLPTKGARTISLARIQNLKLANAVGYEELAGCVAKAKASLEIVESSAS